MSKLQYQTTMSLDGFIAGPGGDMSWMGSLADEPNPIMEELFPQVGVILAGANTFRGQDPNAGTENEGAYDGRYEGKAVVLTHHGPDSAPPGIEFAYDLPSAVTRAKEIANGGYVNVLGADVARQCIEAGILDELLVIVLPVLLGDGVRLFSHAGGRRVDLGVIRSEGMTMLARIVY